MISLHLWIECNHCKNFYFCKATIKIFFFTIPERAIFLLILYTLFCINFTISLDGIKFNHEHC